jgi:hypothetical protein
MKPINTHLDSKLMTQARKLEQLTLVLRNNLPPECGDHYHVTGIRTDTVMIVTDSPAWTTRLRQLSPSILQALATASTSTSTLTNAIRLPHAIHHVRINTRHGPVPDRHQPTAMKRTISQQSRQHIAQTASYISDKKLKNALLQISKHGKK